VLFGRWCGRGLDLMADSQVISDYFLQFINYVAIPFSSDMPLVHLGFVERTK